jgi:hypothetical protein
MLVHPGLNVSGSSLKAQAISGGINHVQWLCRVGREFIEVLGFLEPQRYW